MESLESSARPVENPPRPQNDASAPAQPENLAGEIFNLRSQLFRKKAKTFLPFKQRKMPPRAEEWIGNLADVPIPPQPDAEELGNLELGWGMRRMIRGACPMLHTIYFQGRAQSAWDPMPDEMLVGYLETLAKIPNSFPDIVEEYLPGVFEPIRGERSLDSITPPGSPRWYPKPIIVAACIFAQRRILSDPRTTKRLDEDPDDDDSDYEDSDDEDASTRSRSPGTTLYNRYANLDESDNESDSSYHGSIRLRTRLGHLFSSSVYSISDSDTRYSASDSASTSDHSRSDSASDSASTCSDDSDCNPGSHKTSSDNLDDASASSDSSSEGSDDDTYGPDEWTIEIIEQAFLEADYELLQRGLELPCF